MEEGDVGRKSLEYEFLKPVEFAERLSKGNIVSLIEWSGNYYATQLSELEKSFHRDEPSILLEDIPSAVALKERFPENVTVVFLFSATEAEILQGLDFAAYEDSSNEYLIEWRRRLSLKYDDAEKAAKRTPNESDREDYIRKKMKRAIPDLAFIVGRLREPHRIRVLANRKDKLDEAVQEFLAIMREPKNSMGSLVVRSSDEVDVDPSQLKLGHLIGRMTAPQLWKTVSAILTALASVAVAAYAIGRSGWP